MPELKDSVITDVFTELNRAVFTALKTYSNVHRGSGYKSVVSTLLYDQARDIVLEYLGLNKNKYVLIFCTSRRAKVFTSYLESGSYICVSSRDIGLPLGLTALAVKKGSLRGDIPFQTGGGTASLVSLNWFIKARAPERFEAGTPAIINCITFAKALLLFKIYGKDIFRRETNGKLSADEILNKDVLQKFSGQQLLDKLRLTAIGHDMTIPTMEGTRPYINFDYAASTPTFQPIWNAVSETWRQTHQVQYDIIQDVKSICADFLEASLTNYEVIFTSNTTEAINLVAESLHHQPEREIIPVIVNTLLEHNSNELPWRTAPGLSLMRVSADADGFVDLQELEMLLIAYNRDKRYGRKRITLVSLTGASNVLGVCNNLAEISKIVHQYGAHLLVDAAQLVAHRKVTMESCAIDYLVFSAHKIYAPFGCGVLIVRKGLLNFSASEMELIQASGEENVGGIAALGKALGLLQRIGLDVIQKEEQELTKRTLLGLTNIPDLTIYGIKNPVSSRFAQKTGVIVFGLKGMMANKIAGKLAEGGIGVRYGCHCAHLIIKHMLKIPPILERFQGLIVTLFPHVALPGLTRVSLGLGSTTKDVDILLYEVNKIATPHGIYKDSHFAGLPNGKSVLSRKDFKSQMDKCLNDALLSVYHYKQ